ncbi:MAG TPA: class 3 fructose-bisphosphatase [Cytophagales bacterium]|nr:class 3 fructose-bisphosphatase [Cytophagales bacterium]HAA17904.1 class 3 fructose-bisphosphatase [Cytophagales bacterium]
MTPEHRKYLELLATQFSSKMAVGQEITLLESMLSLPKGPEIFLSDIHGEYESFRHVIKNGSGIIIERLKVLFSDELVPLALKRLATLIYYPEEKLAQLEPTHQDQDAFYETTILQLIRVARDFASIYTSAYVQKHLPKELGTLVYELIQEREQITNKQDYYLQLIRTVCEIGQAEELITAFAKFIQRLAIHRIHIIGDVYDRGPGAEIIMDMLLDFHTVDVQWGNHDIVWMGAAAGSWACMANVLRLSLRYGNTDTLEKGYGINLLPLASFAIEHYKGDDSLVFDPKVSPEALLNASEQWLNRIMHKAISIIQFKLEGQLIQRRPEWNLEDRLLLQNLDLEEGTLEWNGQKLPLKDTFLPTLDPKDPYALTTGEQKVVELLSEAFHESARLQRHARFLFENGGMYLTNNGNLLYHGCIPLQEDGKFAEVNLGDGAFSGKALLDYLESKAHEAYFEQASNAGDVQRADWLWYLWAGPLSPVFGKAKMATFERYFLDDKAAQKETKNPYYQYRDHEATCRMILEEFGLNPDESLIVNGHVPVVVKEGESPLKANGRLLVIDGGFAKAYQAHTGIAGYTLIHNSYGRLLVAHNTFESTEAAILNELDIAGTQTILNQSAQRLRVRDLDDGHALRERITDLKVLLQAYQNGSIKETL